MGKIIRYDSRGLIRLQTARLSHDVFVSYHCYDLFCFRELKKTLQTILIQSRRRLTRHLIRLGTVLKTCCDEIMLKKHDFWFHAFYSQAYSCHFSINIRIAFS
mgnify:CR=1 FL=1